MISNLTKFLHKNPDIINDDKIVNSHDKQSRIERICRKLGINTMLKVTYKRIMDHIRNEPKNDEKARCFLRKALLLNNNSDDNLAIVMDKLNHAILESGYGGPTFVHAYCQRSKCNIELGNFEAALLDINIAIKYGGPNDERSFTRSLAIFYKNLKHFFPSCSTKLNSKDIKTCIENNDPSPWKSLWDYLTNDKLISEDKDDQSQLSGLEELFEFQCNFKIDPRCAIVNNKKKGRHFICQNSIPNGTQVLVERTYSISFDNQFQLRLCLHCCKECEDHFVPCRYCRMAVFCSEECFHRSWSSFHRHECLILSVFDRDKLNLSIHLYRMITKIGVKNALITKRHIDKMKNNNSNLSKRVEKYWNKSIEEIINQFIVERYMNDEKIRNTPDFRMKPSQKNRTYQMMLTLLDHNEKFESYYDMNYIGLAIDTALILLINNYLIRKQSSKQQFSLPHWAHLPKILLKQIIKKNENKQSINELNIFNHSYEDFARLVEILLLNVRKLTTNMFSWNSLSSSGDLQNVATCQCLVGSLINHSCKPNVDWEFVNGCIVYIASRDIEPGEEITNSYGPHSEVPFIKRQIILSQNYYFNCRCEICRIEVEYYPNVLKCQKCSGPVLVIPDSSINSECMNCWQSYKNAFEKMEYVEASFRKFFAIQMLIQNECRGAYDGQNVWFEKMLQCLKDQQYYLYGKNLMLIKNLRIACRLYLNRGELDTACDLAFQLNEIDDDCFSISINDKNMNDSNWIKAIKNRHLYHDIGKMYLQQQQEANNELKKDEKNDEQDVNNQRLFFAKKMVDTYHGDNLFLAQKLFNSLISDDEYKFLEITL